MTYMSSVKKLLPLRHLPPLCDADSMTSPFQDFVFHMLGMYPFSTKLADLCGTDTRVLIVTLADEDSS